MSGEKNFKKKRRKKQNSEHFEDVLSSTEGKSTAFLQIQHLDDPIFGKKSVSPGPDSQSHGLIAQIELAPNSPGEVPIPVRQQEHLVLDLEVLLPGLHDEGVVHRNASDGVDALGFELRGLVDESRQVLLRAGRGEGSRDGEEDGLLALGEVGDRDGLDVAGIVQVGEGRFGKLVADGDGGGDGGASGGGRELEGFWEMTTSEGEGGEGGPRRRRRRKGLGREERGGGGGGSGGETE